MKCRLLRMSQFAFLLLAGLVPVAHAEWQGVGSMTPAQQEGNQITFRNREFTITVTALSPDLIRVRATRGAAPKTDDSYAVVKTNWPAIHVSYAGTRQAGTLRTAEVEVRVQFSPFRLAFYDRNGGLISKDAENLGMAWDGARPRVWKWMPADEHYYGLGEEAGPLDRRGRAFVMWNTDAYGWGETTNPLYVTVPFFLALREGRAYGLFFDNTYRSFFDMGVESRDNYSFGAEGGELNYYFFYGPDPKKVVERYTELVGRMPLPARWALGYHQCRYTYYPESKVRFIADNFRQRRIPCDAIFLDIDFMDGYRVFTWDKSRFPDPPKMVADLRRQGFRMVAMVDPGVKVDPAYWVYQQGLAADAFVKKPDGQIYTGAVWPGMSAFPDFTSPKVREWWAGLYKGLMQDGLAGFWNDMNEPSIFGVPTKTMDLDVIFWDNGLKSPHAKVHNVYGMMMSAANRAGMLREHPNERPLVITRDTYAGGQRYSAVWTGDNSSTWDHLRLSLPEIMNMGLSGLTLVGADIGGFVTSPSPELYTRWLEAGVFYPYCRTHTELGSHNQEPWSFGNELEDINRQSIELRYRLLPYLYNAFHEAAETGLPVMRPLLLDYPEDPRAAVENYEFLVGDDLLVAPVVKSGEDSRNVYLPRGDWYDFWTDRRYAGLIEFKVAAPLDRIPLFVRAGAILPTQQVVQYVDEAPINPLTLEIYPERSSSRDYYEDDGISFDFQRGAFLRRRFTTEQQGGAISVAISAREGTYTAPDRSLRLRVHSIHSAPRRVEVNGEALPSEQSAKVSENAPRAWTYDEYSNLLEIRFPDQAAAMNVRIE